jgi:hypothetical protein
LEESQPNETQRTEKSLGFGPADHHPPLSEGAVALAAAVAVVACVALALADGSPVGASAFFSPHPSAIRETIAVSATIVIFMRRILPAVGRRRK